MTSRPQGESIGPTCILNGHSVHVEEAQAHIARVSSELGARAHVIVTRKGDDISSLAARALSENRHPVVAGGGDGTVSAVAGVLAGTDAAIGVLPMGTLNHFAKDVGIPRHLEAAVRNVFTGEVNQSIYAVARKWIKFHKPPPVAGGEAPMATQSLPQSCEGNFSCSVCV